MKKHLYTIIPLLVLAGPLALSFDDKIHFYTYLWPVLFAILTVGALYIVWDSFVTAGGHWRFNDEFVGKVRFLHLPIGEWLFFLAVPYACLFIYEVVAGYFGRGQLFQYPSWVPAAAGGIILILAFLVRKKGYSFLSLLSSAVFFLALAVFDNQALGSQPFLLYMGLSFGTFLVVNGLYTSMPTIFYGPQAFSGIRIGSIPLEDFSYNLSMLGLYYCAYSWAKTWMLP